MLVFSPSVLIGKKTWVSYNLSGESDQLPFIKPGLVDPAFGFTDANLIEISHLVYAREYTVQKDLALIGKYIFQ